MLISQLRNTYYFLRHGEALSNVKGLMSSRPEKFNNPLTVRGEAMAQKAADQLKDKHIDIIFSSPLRRTKQTAKIVKRAVRARLKFDKRLKEIGFGKLNGRPVADMDAVFIAKPPRGFHRENYEQVLDRMYDFFEDVDTKYQGKHIVIVSHETPIWLLCSRLQGLSIAEAITAVPRDQRIHLGEVRGVSE